jgi:hypothetical protein
MLGDLYTLMLEAADHWIELNRPELAIQCHQAAALYAIAGAAAWGNYQPAPLADPVVLRPLWLRRDQYGPKATDAP